MRILSVVRIEVFPMYGYNYMKKIVLRRADLKEYVIAERDFKYMYPSDFKDLYLLNLQRIESYQTQLNLTKPRWDAKGFEYKHDFTVIDSPRAVTFRDKYGVQMITRFNEIHKFNDGTLHQIDEALDYIVKEFRVNRRNPGLDTRFWTKKDIDRSKEFMFAIQKRLKTRCRYCAIPRSCQSRRDLPRDNPLVSVEVLSKDISYAHEGVEEEKEMPRIKGERKQPSPLNLGRNPVPAYAVSEKPSIHLGRNWVNTFAVRITMMIADIED
ncbi:hypothetical protein Tco_1116621 [Tanacetum coccineum]